MDQVRPFADDRLLVGCLYCGGRADTRDHVPSKVFLDAPFPEQLPVVHACATCNNGFSADEQYLACLVEAAIAGTTEPDRVERAVVAKMFQRSPKLRARIEAARSESEGLVSYAPEASRVLNVILKLARGHAAFELSLPCREEPSRVSIRPLHVMSKEEREEFQDVHVPEIWPEVGSRAMQRTIVFQPRISLPGGEVRLEPLLIQDWIEVQEDRYSYLATTDGAEVRVRILIRGYLACDVRWET